jgi:ethylbenzene dioxygenase ferredoxin component
MKQLVARISEVNEGSPLSVTIDGLPPLAVYQIRDRFFVTDNLCTHGHALLTDGYQDGAQIECPFHGGSFDIETGTATRFPCQISLKTYDVTIDGQSIYINV